MHAIYQFSEKVWKIRCIHLCSKFRSQVPTYIHKTYIIYHGWCGAQEADGRVPPTDTESRRGSAGRAGARRQLFRMGVPDCRSPGHLFRARRFSGTTQLPGRLPAGAAQDGVHVRDVSPEHLRGWSCLYQVFVDFLAWMGLPSYEILKKTSFWAYLIRNTYT